MCMCVQVFQAGTGPWLPASLHLRKGTYMYVYIRVYIMCRSTYVIVVLALNTQYGLFCYTVQSYCSQLMTQVHTRMHAHMHTHTHTSVTMYAHPSLLWALRLRWWCGHAGHDKDCCNWLSSASPLHSRRGVWLGCGLGSIAWWQPRLA